MATGGGFDLGRMLGGLWGEVSGEARASRELNQRAELTGRLQERFERARAENDQEGIRLYGEVLKGINNQAAANAPQVRQAKQFDSDLRQDERQASVGLIVNDIMPAGTKHQTTVANNAAARQMDMVRLMQTGDKDRLEGFLGYLDRNRTDTLAFNREMAQMNQPSGIAKFTTALIPLLMAGDILTRRRG